MAVAFGMTHALPNTMSELMRQEADHWPGFVVSGGLHAPSGTTTSPSVACQAYLPGGGYVEQPAVPITYGALGGTSTCWLGLTASRVGDVGTFKRQPGTHYVVDVTTPYTAVEGVFGVQTRPQVAGVLLLALVHLETGAIAAVDDLRPFCAPDQVRQTVSVKEYGAVGDGVTDDTDAFNRATQAEGRWHPWLQTTIFVPPGDYLIGGTVCVRYGQTLSGASIGASRLHGVSASTQPMIKMAHYLNAAGEVEHDGEAFVFIAPCVENLWLVDGPAAAPALDAQSLGYFVRHLMITNCGVGLRLAGGDGVVSDLLIDQGLTAIQVDAAQTVIVTGVDIFNVRFGIVIHSLVYDVAFVNVRISYPSYAGIQFYQDATSIRNVSFADVDITMNVQHPTMLAPVLLQTGDMDAVFTNLRIRNHPGYAVLQNTGIGAQVKFDGVVIDGSRTHPDYTQSTTAAGFSLQNGTYELSNVTLRNLASWPVQVAGAYYTTVTLANVRFAQTSETYDIALINTDPTSLLVMDTIVGTNKQLYNPSDTLTIKASHLVQWLGASPSGGRMYWTVPFQTGQVFQVTCQANPLPAGGTGNYRKTRTYLVDVSNGWDGAQAMQYLGITALHLSTTTPIVPDLDVQIVFPSVVAVTRPGHTSSGTFLISMPDTYTRMDVDVQPWR